MRGKVVDYLSLERNVSIASAAVFILGLGEELWKKSITPAALVGGLLWSIAPEVPFIVAGLIGLIGTFVFAATVEEKYAS